LVFTPYAFLDKGGQVTCIGSPREGWQRIGAPPGATGWVNSQYIVLQSPPHPADTVNTDTGPAQVEEVARPVPAAPPRPGAESRAAAADQAAIQAPPGLGLTPGNTAAAEETQEEPATTPTVEVVAEPQVQAAVGQAQQPAAAEQAQQPAAAGTQPDSSVRAEMLPPIAVNAPEQPLASVVPLPSPVPVPTAPPDPASAPAPVLVSPAPTPAADPAPVTGVGPVENLPPARVPLVQVRRDGVVVSLGAQSSSVATHYLGLAVGGTEYPVCYLHSTHLSLQEWERKEVRVYGNEVYYQGWKKPVIEVTGIQLRDP
jgi:hypothetical protein